MASYHAVMRKLHVLLVDHDSDCSISTTKKLELCSYKVTYVELASTALSLLSSGQSHFDLVMENINSPDMQGYKLLQHAVNVDIPVILMSIDDDAFLAMGALKKGALLFIKKPVTMDMLKCIWQHVVREKMRIQKENDRIMGMAATNIHSMNGIEFRGEVEEENNNNCKGKKKKRGPKSLIGVDEECEFEHQIINKKYKRKECIQWTQLLHGKFMDAVGQLGEGRCFPKEILELMNVPGLTRLQVASHLQKCRNDNWQALEERKSQQNNVPAESSDADCSGQNKPRIFGSMPRLNNNGLLFQEHREASEGSSKHGIPNDGGHENITTRYPSDYCIININWLCQMMAKHFNGFISDSDA
ncbi:two-component response regulator ARR2-like [Forsythia ovata]|uniref:Two-component response regulator ARR2-like n=1 Tax=Forsythia ovata TaxID=205694 RepID=A0ABD1TVF4_9LAMI